MKAVIIYKSRTGHTKMYAEWIQEATGFDIMSVDHVSETILHEYDLVIFGSRVHAGRIDGLKKFKGLIAEREAPKLVVIATGGTPIEAEEVIDSIWRTSLTTEELDKTPHFYMPAGLNYERMGTGDRLIMKTLSRILGRKTDKSAVEAGCEQAIGESYNISSKEYISPLLEYLKMIKLQE